jgi:acetyltransferase-like isoleucine patch superfamily enzyme
MHCRIISANHAMPAPGTIIRSVADVPAPIVIGQDVWLGAGVAVMAGVIIGDGCIVGAGVVVADELPPYSIAVGTPAKVIRQRA